MHRGCRIRPLMLRKESGAYNKIWDKILKPKAGDIGMNLLNSKDIQKVLMQECQHKLNIFHFCYTINYYAKNITIHYVTLDI